MNLNMMKRIASKSPHARYKHCSLIFAGSRLIAYGYNHGEVHAEIAAIRKLKQIFRNTRVPKNLHMINFMYKVSSGNFGNSAPCDHCSSSMHEAGIKLVTYYDTWYGFRQAGFD